MNFSIAFISTRQHRNKASVSYRQLPRLCKHTVVSGPTSLPGRRFVSDEAFSTVSKLFNLSRYF